MTAPAPAQNPWVLAARPRTLPAAAAPVVLGTALAFAEGGMNAIVALSCLVGALALQVGANFANDLSDFVRGADTAERVGPVRVTAAGLLSPAQVRLGAVVAFGVASLAGLYLIAVAGWPILAIGVCALLAAVTYVGGPVPYGYRGLGEVFVFIFFGLAAVVGTYYAQRLTTSAAAWAGGAALGGSASAVLVVNNVRDRVTDLASGKRTLVAVFGRRFGDRLYAAFMALSVVGLAVCGVLLRNPLLIAAAVWAAWQATGLVRQVKQTDGPALNPLLGATASFGLRAALFASAAIVLFKAVSPA